jgi:hypothetical protein
VPRDAVEEDPQRLRRRQALRPERLIDQLLHHHELVHRRQRDPLHELLEAFVELCRGRRLDREAPVERRRAVDQVAGEQQPLGALVAHPERPQRRGRHAPDAGGRVADARVVGDHQQVGAERHVGAARDAEAVHLADDGLVRIEQAHEAAQVAAHHLPVDHRVPRLRRVVVGDLLLCELDQVVAPAEALPGPCQRDHVHRAVEVGLLDAVRQLAWHRERDPVAALRPVEGDAGDAAVDLVGNRLHRRTVRLAVMTLPLRPEY